MIAAPPQFFGVLSRHFVVTFMHQLSRVATRVYAYLRTWCFSEAGQGTPWRQISVAKMARDLSWSDRYVRKGLAELEAARLLERRADYVEVPGEPRAQRANHWRILPEPGFPTERETPPAPRETPPEDKLTGDRIRQVSAAITVETQVTVEAVPEWTEEAIRKADADADALEAAADETDAAPPVVDGPGVRLCDLEDDRERRAEAINHRAAARALRDEAERLAPLRSLPAQDQAASDRWYGLVIETVANRVHRRLRAVGLRERVVARVADRTAIESFVREYLHNRGSAVPPCLPGA